MLVGNIVTVFYSCIFLKHIENWFNDFILSENKIPVLECNEGMSFAPECPLVTVRNTASISDQPSSPAFFF